ncbi:hypothetical protein P8452_27304 [Trifolium repens]|nr:hypothetical protein P8452_27304 [Trifolium repens]
MFFDGYGYHGTSFEQTYRCYPASFIEKSSGPVELAAAGVSIAVFNQASRITIFPLVSITTSFVAEEDTIDKINRRAAEKQFNENIKPKTNEVMPNDHMLQDIEAGATKQDGTLKNETKNGDDANSKISKSSMVTSNGNKSESKPTSKKRHIASASTTLLFSTVLGLIQAATLIFAAKPLLGAMGLKYGLFRAKRERRLLWTGV